jgi:class I lanthipeptide synthase
VGRSRSAPGARRIPAPATAAAPDPSRGRAGAEGEPADLAGWPAVLDRPLTELAAAAVDAIAAALLEAAGGCDDPTLAHGRAGIALFLAERDRRADSGSGGAPAAALHAARALVAQRPLGPGLFEGVAGITWLTAQLMPDSAAAMNASFDRLLAERLRDHRWEKPFDLFTGPVGFGVYALERVADEAGRELLRLAIERLAELVHTLADGLAWSGWCLRSGTPRRGYHLGVAHGTPGAIALLAAAIRAGHASPLAVELLDGAMCFMLARARDDRDQPALAQWHFPGEADLEGRSAWCNGDPGACVAMLAGARALGRPDWERRIVEIALAAATRDPEQTRVCDPSLCHGEAGLGHIFHRLYAMTGEQSFACASRHWYSRLLARLDPAAPVAGFACLRAASDQPGESQLDWRAEPGFIAGAAGVGLALLAASGGAEPRWDRALLLSGPSPAA